MDLCQDCLDAVLERGQGLVPQEATDGAALQSPSLGEDVTQLRRRRRVQAVQGVADKRLHGATAAGPILAATVQHPALAFQAELTAPPKLAQSLEEPLAAAQLGRGRVRGHGSRLAVDGPEFSSQRLRQGHAHLDEAVPTRTRRSILADIPEDAHGLLAQSPELLLSLEEGEQGLEGLLRCAVGGLLQIFELRRRFSVLVTASIIRLFL
mmetsp:Transcript_17219/g.36549  ORF Transcript_17219/g.36549 Transcript_17219/m.36549 type:complete len:209 (-) Transcript_17219:326-952(-)